MAFLAKLSINECRYIVIKEHWNHYQTISFYREPVETNYSTYIKYIIYHKDVTNRFIQ